jgi:hypothetical protein
VVLLVSPLAAFQSVVNALKQECFNSAEEAGLFLQVDEAGNIWLGDGNGECYRVHGWHMTHQKINEIISKKASD